MRFVLLSLALGATASLFPVMAVADDMRVPAPDSAQPLQQMFGDPPMRARPFVWWHWLDGNVTEKGIEEDIEWMSRIGLGGVQNFVVGLKTPLIVDKRLEFMTPDWKHAFRFAAEQAEKHGLELGIASSPGWSETGGPWVEPKDALKKLVWSETIVRGGSAFSGKLPAPPRVTGPFQDMPYTNPLSAILGAPTKATPEYYSDIAVLAVPETERQLPVPRLIDGRGQPVAAAPLTDSNLETAIALPPGDTAQPATVTLTYTNPVTVRSATLFVPGAKSMFTGATLAPVLEVSTNGAAWNEVAQVPLSEVPTTISFAPVTARWFRMVFKPAKPGGFAFGDPAPGVVPPPFVEMLSKASAAPIRLAELRLSARPEVDRFEVKAGFALVPDYFALGSRNDDAHATPVNKVIDLTDRVASDGTLSWTPPPGSWRVIRIGSSLLGTTNQPAPPEATGLEVDKFDGDAVRRYLEHYLGLYQHVTGDELLGKHGVRALLTDSIEVGAANWTPKMLVQFKALRGYDARPWLPALTGVIIGSRRDSDRFLYDWRRTLSDLMSSQHYETVADVAHEHGLKVYGEALEHGRPSLGDDMSMRSHTDVPMAAMWTFSRRAGPMPSHLADIKGAASVAHLYGQNIVAAESMTSALAYWAYSPRDLRRIIDLEFVTGVNRPIVHTSVHSPSDDKEPGLSLMFFGQYFNRHESWAPLAKAWVDYMARSSLLLQQGRDVADVGYLYGEEAPLTGLYGENPVGDAPVTSAYDFVSNDALMHLLHNDGHELVAPGGARYRALYLGGSSYRMTLGTLRRLATLVEGGATIVGTRPVSSPSLMDAGDEAEWRRLADRLWSGGPNGTVGKGRVIASNDIEAALRSIDVKPDFSFTRGGEGADIPFIHRRDAKGEIYFLVNRKNRPESIEAHFRVTGKAPQLWHADSGAIEPVSYRMEGGETIVPLNLAAEDSVFVVFREESTLPSLNVARPELNALDTIRGPWTVTFQPGRGAPASAVFKTLSGLQENADPAIRYFSGIASYSHSFAAPKNWRPGQPLWLDLGEIDDIAQVTINGNDVGTVWHAPYRVDISRAATVGRNSITVRVANLWVNRLIGDAQPGATKVTWTAIPTYGKDAPLRRSGMTGPVTLLGPAPPLSKEH